MAQPRGPHVHVARRAPVFHSLERLCGPQGDHQFARDGTGEQLPFPVQEEMIPGKHVLRELRARVLGPGGKLVRAETVVSRAPPMAVIGKSKGSPA